MRYTYGMSCISAVGREYQRQAGGGPPLPFSMPPWTWTKHKRLVAMARSESPSLRAVAAGHPRLPLMHLWQLLRDMDPVVARAAVKNPRMEAPDFSFAEMRARDEGVRAYARMRLREMGESDE